MQQIILTSDQDRVFSNFKEWLERPNDHVFVLTGSAGVGKTLLTRFIARHVINTNPNAIICAIAPTHKARRVLSNFLNSKATLFGAIPVVTIAALLKKGREHSYIGTHKYSSGDTSGINKYTHFILDELSMVSNKDTEILINAVLANGQKLVAIGDSCQIPSPSQGMVKKGEYLERMDNILFHDNKRPVNCLTQIVRQSETSPIIKMATFLRDHMTNELSMSEIINSINDEHVINEIVIKPEQVASIYLKYKNHQPRIITYTNTQVQNYNIAIRKALNYTSAFHQGELLMGYASVGWPEPLIENGRDYIITSIVNTNTFSIEKFILSGYYIKLSAVDDPLFITPALFFININSEQNVDFLNELARRAQIVNSPRSTREDFKKYCALKNRIVVCQDVYQYGHTVYDEQSFKKLHPLLFTRTTDVFNKSLEPIPSELYNLLQQDYEPVLQHRSSDSTKAVGDSEQLADLFKIIEKDITFGYALTAHKSQGSTIHTVIIDGVDFERISKNRWNSKFKLYENRVKEQNQLRYVAITRASHHLFITSTAN